MKKLQKFFTLLVLTCLLVPNASRAQAEFQSRHFMTSDSVKLHYLEAGSGPTLVLVPGWTMPAEIWKHQLRHFASTHRVIALDPRGQGCSEKPAHGYQPSRRALDIGELLEHLGGEPAVVAGWSLAMQEVLVLAHEYGTENIRAAVLVDHPINTENPQQFTSRFISLQTEREEWTRKFIKAIHRSPQPEEYFETLTQAALSTPTNAAAMMIANNILMGPTDLRPALESLDRPALFIYSSLDWAVQQAERVRKNWPEIPVEIIDETSHALFVDNPETFNRVLEEFLATLPDVGNDTSPQVQSELQEVVNSIVKDLKTANIKGIQAHHLDSKKFTKFGPRNFNRQDVQSTNQSEEAFFGSITNYKLEIKDLKIDVFGNIGIVTYYPEVSFIQNGEQISGSGRQTLVFLKTEKGWKIVHEHGTLKR